MNADVRRSATWLLVYTTALVIWLTLYWTAGPWLLGESLYKKLDIESIDLSALGLNS